jgi:cell wall-associated NlpC family hydrolase
MKKIAFAAFLLICLRLSCTTGPEKKVILIANTNDSLIIDSIKKDTAVKPIAIIDTPKIILPAADSLPKQLVNFAKTLIGTPYLYASTNREKGFDCSGFITYVFNHFKITVPRSSVDFTNVGTPINIKNAVGGDLILFTGTDSTSTIVGHMGIVTENTDSLRFIHSSSGKANGVTITALNKYYVKRFVKVIRIW